MARLLNIYTGRRINEGENTHILASSITRYVNTLGTPALSLPFPNYRIVEGLVLISESDGLGLSTAQRCTYCVDYDAAIGFMRCYFVDAVDDVSGYIRLHVRLDNWGTYIWRASMSNMHVARCNKKLSDRAVFDDISLTHGKQTRYDLDSEVDLINCCAVFLLSYNVAETLIGNNYVTAMGLFSIRLTSVANCWNADIPAAANIPIIEKAIMLLGGIYQTGASRKAHVVRMWILPNPALESNLQYPEDLKSYTPHGDISITQGQVYRVNAGIIEKTIDVAQLLNDAGETFGDIYPNGQMEIGTGQETMPMTRFYNDFNVTYKYVFGNADVKVIVSQGLNQKEISSAYEVSITTNNMIDTATEAAAKTIATTASALLAIAKGYGSGGPAGAVAAGVGVGVATLGRTRSANSSNATLGSGDGLQALQSKLTSDRTTKVKAGHTLVVYSSVDDEITKAMMKGAKYDFYLDSFVTLSLAPYLFPNPPRNVAFIAIDELLITGINGDAVKYISDEFRRGVWLHQI